MIAECGFRIAELGAEIRNRKYEAERRQDR
jgi:hypothetical protein